MLDSAEGLAEHVAMTVRMMNLLLANIFWRHCPMRTAEVDLLIQTTINVNLLLENLAKDLSFDFLRLLRRDMIRTQARDLRLCVQFRFLDFRVNERVRLLNAYQDALLRIWIQIGGGRLSHRLSCDIHLRPVISADRGFLLLD